MKLAQLILENSELIEALKNWAVAKLQLENANEAAAPQLDEIDHIFDEDIDLYLEIEGKIRKTYKIGHRERKLADSFNTLAAKLAEVAREAGELDLADTMTDSFKKAIFIANNGEEDLLRLAAAVL